MQKSELESKFLILRKYGIQQSGRTFSSVNRNELAKAIIFSSLFSKYNELVCSDYFDLDNEPITNPSSDDNLDDLISTEIKDFDINKCSDYSEELEAKLLDLANKMIEVIEATPEFWNLFWQGKHEIDPTKFIFTHDYGLEIKYLNLNEVESFKMPFLGLM